MTFLKLFVSPPLRMSLNKQEICPFWMFLISYLSFVRAYAELLLPKIQWYWKNS